MFGRQGMGRSTGIEPVWPGPQPGALPLSYDRHFIEISKFSISKFLNFLKITNDSAIWKLVIENWKFD